MDKKGLRAANAQAPRGWTTVTAGESPLSVRRSRRGWQQKPREGPRGGYPHGPERSRRTPRGGESFSTAGLTAKSAAAARGQHRQPKELLRPIHPRMARLIDTFSPLASTGLWRVPRLSFTRSKWWQHETPPYTGLARGPTPLCPLPLGACARSDRSNSVSRDRISPRLPTFPGTGHDRKNPDPLSGRGNRGLGVLC